MINLSREQAQGLFWNDEIQSLVIKRLLDGLSQTAENFYRENQSLNALVVIDEAHRLAPRDLPREGDAARGVRSVLIDAARTTPEIRFGMALHQPDALQPAPGDSPAASHLPSSDSASD